VICIVRMRRLEYRCAAGAVVSAQAWSIKAKRA
jgi:hypothetical protein